MGPEPRQVTNPEPIDMIVNSEYQIRTSLNR